MRIARVFTPAVGAALVVCSLGAAPAFAQGQELTVAIIPPPAVVPQTAAHRSDADALVARQALAWRAAPDPQRPSALIPLSVSQLGLQALDIHSSHRAITSGNAYEANPAMSPFVKNSAAFASVKFASAGGVIWISEKLWKKQPKKAVVFAALINTGMAAIVAHNYNLQK
jgi:hypothetical protein